MYTILNSTIMNNENIEKIEYVCAA